LQTVNGTIGEALVNYMLKKFLLRQKSGKMIHNILAYQNRINNQLGCQQKQKKGKKIE
jgi:hypothetical protein